MCRLRARHLLLRVAVLSTLLACGGEPASPRPFARRVAPPGTDVSVAGGAADGGAADRKATDGPATAGDAGPAMPVWDADEVVAGLRPSFLACYKAGLSTDWQMQGRVLLSAKVSAAGEVMSTRTISREGLSAEVEACLLDVVSSARFAPPGGGGSTLNVPITFRR